MKAEVRHINLVNDKEKALEIAKYKRNKEIQNEAYCLIDNLYYDEEISEERLEFIIRLIKMLDRNNEIILGEGLKFALIDGEKAT